MDERLWRAIVNCETTFDGIYYYAVVSTGIFCRPSCKSRQPKADNVRIFASVEDAQNAGFRPCKRCRPKDNGAHPDAVLVSHVKSFVAAELSHELSLAQIASAVAVSPYHLHRVFKRWTGVTPTQYVFECKIEAAKRQLATTPQATITSVALAVGFRSSAHFATAFRRATGCSPTEYQRLHHSSGMTQETEEIQ